MIQDIKPHRFDNRYYSDSSPKDDDFVIVYRNNRSILVKVEINTGKLTFPTFAQCENKKNLIYLFSIDHERFFLDLYAEDYYAEHGFEYLDTRRLRALTSDSQEYMFAAFTAMHLAEWYMNTRFCGKCGCGLKHDRFERAMRCNNCGDVFYPRINPAVIVGVTNGDQLLLTKYKSGYSHNALVAGFTEIGETLEQTVEREVMEETGIKVKNICYYKSQPWGIACDLLAGFFCEADGDTNIRMDSNELRYARWVNREEIELQPQDYSLTNEMMRVFKEGVWK